MQRIFYFFILFLPSILWATPKLAILPFSHNDRITERYYLLMYSTFSKTVEADPGYSLMSYDDTVNAIKEAGLTEKQLLTSSDAAVFGKALGVDFVIYGNIALNTTTLPLPRGFTISNYVMNVFMADVETGHLLNHVAWSISDQSNFIQFSESIAYKLLWKSPGVYPAEVLYAGPREGNGGFNRDDFRARMRDFLAQTQFPKETEIDAISISVQEKKTLAATGFIGCVTLIGWIFLPSYALDSRVKINVRIKFRDENGLQSAEIEDEISDSKYSHLLSDQSRQLQIQTERIFLSVQNSIMGKIRGDSRFYRKAAENPI